MKISNIKDGNDDDLSQVRIVIGGPKNSGKSVFAVYFFRAFRQLGIRAYHYDYDPYSPTRELVLKKIDNTQREKLKKMISDEEARDIAKNFQNNFSEYDIIIGDLPGQISDVSKILISAGTHSIVVCRADEEKEINVWRSMFNKLNVKTVCVVKTFLADHEEINESDIIYVETSNLDRNDVSETVPATILALTEKIKNYIRS
ncbi:MAG: hypothetical protein ACRENO_02125 [Thermodesulfobacteriota bacterium]